MGFSGPRVLRSGLASEALRVVSCAGLSSYPSLHKDNTMPSISSSPHTGGGQSITELVETSARSQPSVWLQKSAPSSAKSAERQAFLRSPRSGAHHASVVVVVRLVLIELLIDSPERWSGHMYPIRDIRYRLTHGRWITHTNLNEQPVCRIFLYLKLVLDSAF